MDDKFNVYFLHEQFLVPGKLDSVFCRLPVFCSWLHHHTSNWKVFRRFCWRFKRCFTERVLSQRNFHHGKFWSFIFINILNLTTLQNAPNPTYISSNHKTLWYIAAYFETKVLASFIFVRSRRPFKVFFKLFGSAIHKFDLVQTD
jgi:hypothetical protein